MNDTLAFVLLGLIAGTLSGVIGVGGGVIIVPVLVFLFHFSQHKAEGTTLALLIPPIGILAVLPYFKHGYVDLRAAALICLGFVFGGAIGGHLATGFSNAVLQRVFAIALALIAARMLLVK